MSEMLYKVLDDCEIKKLEDRTYEFTASTSNQDRDGEVIEASGWDLKNFKKNPVIMYAHDYRSLPVGRAPRIWVSSDGKLKNTVEFPSEGTYEFADIVERLVDKGYLKTESVGFIPKKWEDGDSEKAPKRTYTKQELLEISIVPIPSNPDALRNAIEDGIITTKEFDAITKPEETDDWIRIPVAECDVTATIDISKKEGIKALYCGKEKKVRTYLFDKREPFNWTMAKAKKWVEEHKGEDEDKGVIEEITEEIPHRKALSQEEISDELAYVRTLIEEGDLNDDNKELIYEIISEWLRLTGDDIPDDILGKVGAVLNAKNRSRLNQIKQLADQVLESAEKPEGEPSKAEPKPTVTLEQIKEVAKEIVDNKIAKLRGQI